MTDEDLVTRLTSQIEGLKEVIGQEVEVYALRFLIDKTKSIHERGPLFKVNFDSVKIGDLDDNVNYPFIGFSVGVQRILQGSKVLYFNPLVTKDSKLSSTDEVYQLTLRCFGLEVAEQFKNNRERWGLK